MKVISRFAPVVALLVMLMPAAGAQDNALYFIDAHSQVDHQVVPLEKVIAIMKQGGVSRTILSSRGKLKDESLLALAGRYPDEITPAIRTKGRPYDTGSNKYYKKLDRQAASGRFSAMAEVLLYHAQKGNKAQEIVVYPEDRRVQVALKHAVENQWPFVVHIEFGSLRGDRKHFMESLERMLEQYPEQPFVLTHMGQLKPEDAGRLIQKHANLHFHTGWTNPAAVNRSNQPWVNIFKDNHLAPEWRDLFVQYPGRFVFALDNVFAEHWTGFYVKQMDYWREALSKLPSDVAHLIAHGNAERLWHIPPGG